MGIATLKAGSLVSSSYTRTLCRTSSLLRNSVGWPVRTKRTAGMNESEIWSITGAYAAGGNSRSAVGLRMTTAASPPFAAGAFPVTVALLASAAGRAVLAAGGGAGISSAGWLEQPVQRTAPAAARSTRRSGNEEIDHKKCLRSR